MGMDSYEGVNGFGYIDGLWLPPVVSHNVSMDNQDSRSYDNGVS